MKDIDLLGLPLIKCHHKKFEDYTLYNDDYIIGIGDLKESYISDTTSIDILLSFLKLSAKLKSEGLLQSMLIEKNELIRASYIIIDYCRKYGLLSIEDDYWQPTEIQYKGFPIANFVYRLMKLSEFFQKESNIKKIGSHNVLPYRKISITFQSIMYDETNYSFAFEAKDLITLAESQVIIYVHKESKDIVEGYIKYSEKNNDYYISQRKTRKYQGINGDTKQNMYNKLKREAEPEIYKLHNRIYQRLYQRGIDRVNFTSQSNTWNSNFKKGIASKEDYIKWLHEKDLETKQKTW